MTEFPIGIKEKFAFLILLGLFFIVISLQYTSQLLDSYNHRNLEIRFNEKVIFSTETEYQHVALKENLKLSPSKPSYSFFLNGEHYLDTDDEHIYHSMLVSPPMLAANKQDNILIIGGGDGLAIRDALKWDPKQITILELDREMIALFSQPHHVDGKIVNEALLNMNQGAFEDPRVNILYGDAYNTIEHLISISSKFDVIIVDLPDPNYPALSKLYSVQFYRNLYHVLDSGGAIAIQSSSPKYDKYNFLTIGVTMRHAGFDSVERYHHRVPSFGDWGWTIATKTKSPPSYNIKLNKKPLPADSWVTKPILMAAFSFEKAFFAEEATLQPNMITNPVMYYKGMNRHGQFTY